MNKFSIAAAMLILALSVPDRAAVAQEATTSGASILAPGEMLTSTSTSEAGPDIASTSPMIDMTASTTLGAADSASSTPVVEKPGLSPADPTIDTDIVNMPETEASTTPDTAPSTAGTILPDGALITDGIWTKDASPYVIGGETLIEGSLRIEPGTVVKLRGGASLVLVSGTLTVGSANAADEVVFTSLADDSVAGDTNADGAASDPDELRWKQITVAAGTHADIEHARFRYAGGATYAQCRDPYAAPSIPACYDAEQSSGVIFTSGTLAVRDSEFEWTGGADILATQGAVTLERDQFDTAALLLNVEPPPSFLNIPGPTITMRDSSISAPIRLSHGHALFDFKENWWGTPAGPQSGWYTAGYDPYEDVSAETYVEPWLTSDPFGDTSDPCANGCASSVLFLPGIEGSRLYDADDKLWEPFDALDDGVSGVVQGAGDARIQALGLDTDGKSVRGDIYAKDGDIIDQSAGVKFYASFIAQMDGLKERGVIDDWKPVAYDWRLSLPDIVTRGAERNGKIYYEEATDTPYIEQTLRSLAATSKTGKVAIIAHSNGGLVAKALMERLGGAETARLVDKVIMVGVPQTGAPETVGALLFGAGQDIPIPRTDLSIVTQAAARGLAGNAPMSYHLLPSQAYFDAVPDPAHPVVSFTDQSVYGADFAAFGGAIHSWAQLAAFLSGTTDARMAPATEDVAHPAVANTGLLGYAKGAHDALDIWAAPAGTKVYQIAGWGEDTVSGVELYDKPRLGGILGFVPQYRPAFVEDGDGTVPVPSALLMSGTSTERYWLNLQAYSNDAHRNVTHGQELEVPDVLSFISDALTGSHSAQPYLTTSAPASSDVRKRLRFILHNGTSIEVFNDGLRTGSGTDGPAEESIPDSSYGWFGEDQYVSVPQGNNYRVVIAAAGAADLDIEEESGARISTIPDIPLKPGVTGMLTISDIDDASDIVIDGDGATTSPLEPPGNTTETSTTTGEGAATSTPIGGAASSTDATSTPDEESGGSGNSHTSASSGSAAPGGISTTSASAPAKDPKPKQLKIAKPVKKKAPVPANKPPTTAEIKAASKQVEQAVAQTSELAAAIAAIPPDLIGALNEVVKAFYTFLSRIAQTLTYLLRLIL